MEENKKYIHRIWADINSTGIDSIDNHHKKYIEVINNLVDILNNDKETAEVLDVFHKLLYYAETYFLDEELLYQRNNYADLTKHKQEHKDFIAEINHFRDDYQEKENTVCVRMMKYLDIWYKNHILIEDIKAVKG